MIIATKNVSIHLPSGRTLRLVKGERISPATLRKMSASQKKDYTQTEAAQITRRIPNRRAALDSLGIYSDVNLVVMEEISTRVPNDVISSWKRNQVSKIRAIESVIIKEFALSDRKVAIEGITDDILSSTEATCWYAWPLNPTEAESAHKRAAEVIAEKLGY